MPLSLHLDTTGRVCGYDPSRAEHADGTPGEGWVWATPAQYAAAQSYGYPKWTGSDVMNDPPPAPTLAQLKAAATEANRAECRSRILARWDENKQRSAALGVYPPSECDACADWIAANIAAENAAADLIDAAADAAGVAAVVVNWPA